jgi:hypothetical protein
MKQQFLMGISSITIKWIKICGFIDYERRILFYYWPGPSTREQTYTNRILLDFAK